MLYNVHYRAHIITTDFNLNKVCHVHGIQALNVNDLSEAIKPSVHQGDQFSLLLTKTTTIVPSSK